MSIILDLLDYLYDWMRPHNSNIAMAQVATLLVIYGDGINTIIKNSLADFHVVLRFTIYVAICAFGYGALTVTASKSLAKFLDSLNSSIYPLVVVSSFIFIAFLAQKVKHI